MFSSENDLVKVKRRLEEKSIFPRRYFYPSLNTLNFCGNSEKCNVSEKISNNILCLPNYFELTIAEIENIAIVINNDN
jgi:dTDP-4-amino-4,6-dideoxygalactose transaminase